MFTWKPVYKEITNALFSFRARQPELIRILADIKRSGLPVIRLVDAPNPATAPVLEEIDPFTFFATFNRGVNNENRVAILKAIKERLTLSSGLPSDFDGIPVVDNLKSWFFPYANTRKTDDVAKLWELAGLALHNPPEKLDPKVFNRCLQIDAVWVAKLTMGLFWLNPEDYIALDSLNGAHFSRAGISMDVQDHASYVELLGVVRHKLGRDYPAISRRAFMEAEEASSTVHYWAGGSTWGDESKADEFIKGNVWEIGWEKDNPERPAQKTWKYFDEVQVGDEFAIKGYGGRNDLRVYYIGKVTEKSGDGTLKLQKLNRPLFRGKAPKGPTWFDTLVPITNRPAIDAIFRGGGQGDGDAEGEVEVVSTAALPPALNLILYGPPGTGKTHRLRNYYMGLFTERQAALTEDERATAVAKELSWWEAAALALLDSKDKKASVAQIAAHPLVQARVKLSSNKNLRAVLWASLQSHTKKDCPNVNYTSRMDPLLFWKDENSVWSIDSQAADKEVPELRKQLEEFRRPPTAPSAIERFKFTTFHQSFSYEDFVEGIKPQTSDKESGEQGEISYDVKPGIFKEICLQAKDNPTKRYAVFIDEINRGNVASIFGELITLIEEDKRLSQPNQLTAVLPYSREEFGVPSNVYIIGTMNTADRSVEALDTALRRRFTFEEIRPEPDKIMQPAALEVDLKKIFQTVNARIEQLLDRDHCIGHSYFMGIHNLAELRSSFANKIIPLLREYFYGNPARVGMILGERFVSARTERTAFAAGDWGLEDLDEKVVYEFRDPSGFTAEDFASIYGPPRTSI